MTINIDRFFDNLKKHLDAICNSQVDNEAMRHDLLIRPIITSPLVLGWNCEEVIAQSTVDVPLNVRESYFWDKAKPKKRRPDMIVVPYGMNKTVAVIEEKKRQVSLTALANRMGQIKEYQYLHNAVWGLLTDGEKWILQKNNEIFHTFSTLDDLRKNLEDFKQCIGRSALMKRLTRYGTADLVIVKPSVNVTLVLSLSRLIPKSSLKEYLLIHSIESLDFLQDIHVGWHDVLCIKSKGMLSTDMYELVEDVYSNFLVDLWGAMAICKELILMESLSKTGLKKSPWHNKYRKLLDRWLSFFPRINKLTADINSGIIWQIDTLMELFADSQYPLWLSDSCSETFLKEIIESQVFHRLPIKSQKSIRNLYRDKVYLERGNQAPKT